MARGENLNLTHIAIAFINGVVYLALGIGLFRLAERQAKETRNFRRILISD
ncbi:MAG: hypothetical protein CLLPBCKN_003825 [Chroococcidiopsis cubana SAG 39.79]|uniref:hypothetical protein n=1 Tax=Chroococcidiopsis cubana TaxID=171392 RepID=UPI002AC5F106|nr:hypothetical protein [Chroococcidiopsis cubana]MDZ4874429.1 hypothetical protein [Chroococcidiopsis cubana SAG 39.79]